MQSFWQRLPSQEWTNPTFCSFFFTVWRKIRNGIWFILHRNARLYFNFCYSIPPVNIVFEILIALKSSVCSPMRKWHRLCRLLAQRHVAAHQNETCALDGIRAEQERNKGWMNAIRRNIKYSISPHGWKMKEKLLLRELEHSSCASTGQVHIFTAKPICF